MSSYWHCYHDLVEIVDEDTQSHCLHDAVETPPHFLKVRGTDLGEFNGWQAVDIAETHEALCVRCVTKHTHGLCKSVVANSV